MKRNILLLSFFFICITSSAQIVTLAIHQDYLVPDIPVITQNGDILRSSSPIGNHWFKDGVELLGQINQTLSLTNSGIYTVSVTLGSGCSRESKTYNAIKTDVPIIQTADFICRVFPNPNNGMFTVELESDHPYVFGLELFSSNGRSIVNKTVNYTSGIQHIPFGKSSIAKGVYYLQINFGSNVLSRQIIVN